MKTATSISSLYVWFCAGLLSIVLGATACSGDSNPAQRVKSVDVIEYDTEMRSILERAALLKEHGKIDSAVQLLQLFKQRAQPELMSSTRWRYYDLVGSVAFDSESYDLALYAGVLQEAVPSSASLKTSLETARAHSLKKLGDTVKAIQWYRNVIDKTNAYVAADSHRNLAWLFISQKMYDSTLHRLALADSLSYEGFLADVTAKAWCAFTRARAYASLGKKANCMRELEYGLRLLEGEDEYRLGDPRVRRSICQGVLDDSSRFLAASIPWSKYRLRLQQIVITSSNLLQAETEEYNHRQPLRSKLMSIISLDGTNHGSTPLSLNQLDYITDVAMDDRGWQWVSAITGTYLRAGPKLLQIVPVTEHGSIPTRSIRIDQRWIRRTYYSGRRDKAPINRYVQQNPDTLSWLTRATHQWSFLPWSDSPATAVTPYGKNSDTLIYVFANTIGLGTTTTLPRVTRPLRLANGTPWKDTVTHLVSVTPSIVFASSNRGVWAINPSTGIIQKVTLQPSTLNSAFINALGYSEREGLLTIEGAATYAYATTSLRDLHFKPGVTVYAALQSYMSKINGLAFLGNNAMDFNSAVIPFDKLDNSLQVPIEYHLFNPCINSDSSYAILYPYNVALYGLTTYRLALSAIPEKMVPRDRITTLKYCDSAWNVGIVTPKGLLVGSMARVERQPGGTLITYKSTGDRLYRVGSDGADIILTSSQREVELSINRPSNYGGLQVPLLVNLPWNDSTFSITTGTEFVLGEIPPGEHIIRVTATDQPVVVPIRLLVEPTLAESRWFQIVAGSTLGLLVIVGFQYARLQTIRRKEQQQRNLLEERLAIGRDLHDAVGADLVRINMLTKEIQETRITREIRRAVREANRNLRDIIWSVADPHTLDAVIALLAERIRAGAEEAGLSAEIDVPFELPKWSVAPQVLRDVTLVVTEALTNTIKHAAATMIQYRVTQHEASIVIEIIDNGQGFGIETPKTGLGMESMYARARRSGFDVSVNSRIGNGTTVRLELPQV